MSQEEADEAALQALLGWQAPTSALAVRPRRSLRAAVLSVTGVAAAVGAFLAAGARAHKQRQKSEHELKVEALEGRVAKEEEAAEASLQMLNVYLARCNGAWAEEHMHTWVPPRVWPGAPDPAWTRTREFGRARGEAVSCLQLGKIALQLVCSEDSLTAPDGSPAPDLWTSDPWALLSALRPGAFPMKDRVEGVSLCGRALVSIAGAVRAVGGDEAVDALPVILHLHDGQVDAVVSELCARAFYGLNPKKLLLTVARRHPGFRWDPEARAFCEGADAAGARDAVPLGPRGSGFSCAQLTWAGEALRIQEDGTTSVLPVSVLEHLSSVVSQTGSRVQWVVSRRARDLGLLTPGAPGSCFDPLYLAWCMCLSEAYGGRAVAEVLEGVTDTGLLRVLDSEVVGVAGPEWSTPPPAIPDQPKAAWDVDLAALLPEPMRPPAESHPQQGLPGVVCELRGCEISTAAIRGALERVKGRGGSQDGEGDGAGSGTVAHSAVGGLYGVGRYMIKLETLKAALSHPTPLRPRLALTGPGLVSVSLDIADVGRARGCPGFLAMRCRSKPVLLGAPGSIEALLATVTSQDTDPAFRGVLPDLEDMRDQDRALSEARQAAASGRSPKALSERESDLREEREAQGAVIAFVTHNTMATATASLAARLTKPGRDMLHVVSAVPGSTERAQGDADVEAAVQVVLDRQYGLQERQVATQVLVRNGRGLLDAMEAYVLGVAQALPQGRGAARPRVLVVMGSSMLTAADFSYVVGSVTLGLAKRLRPRLIPLVITTANAKQTAGPKDGLRAIALVTPGASGLVATLGSRLMEPTQRPDRLLLLRAATTHSSTRAAQAADAQALNDYMGAAHSRGLNVQRNMTAQGALEDVVTSAVADNAANLVALPVAPGPASLAFPASVLALLRTCKAPTLLYYLAESDIPPVPSIKVLRGAARAHASHDFGHTLLT
uniref:Uncharacterized protein n=1 Tax=Chlamydomonas leiostraca TaxID=1034604 RepID=A0A7S0S6R9_9CHLO